MRKLYVLSLLTCAVFSHAQILVPILTGGKQCCTYYVSNSGSDAANGLTPATAWQTVAKVNATTLVAGQSVGFQRGGLWREVLTPGQGGTVGSPITFQPYGTGLAPIINGSSALSGWAAVSAPSQQACTGSCSFSSGMETGGSGFTDWTSIDLSGGGSTVVQSTVQVSHGTYSAAMTGNGTDNRVGLIKNISSPVAGTSVYFRFYIYIPTGSLKSSDNFKLFSSPQDGNLGLNLYTNGSGNVSQLQNYANGCAPCATNITFPMDSWNYIDLKLTVGTTTGNGSAQVWLNGTSVGSSTTLNTTIFTDITSFEIGNISFGHGMNSGTPFYIDDAYVSGSGPIGAFPGVPPNTYSVSLAPNPATVWFTGVMGTLQSSMSALSNDKDYFYGSSTLYIVSTTPPSSRLIEVPNLNYNVDTNGKNYVTVSGLVLTEALTQNFYCRGSQHCSVSGSTLSNGVYAGYQADGTTGGNNVANSQIFGWGQHGIQSQPLGDSGGNTYTGNTIFGGGWNPTVGTGDSEAIAIAASNDVITNNIVHDLLPLGTQGLNDGISIGGVGYQLTGVVISGNTVYNIPEGSGIWFGNASGIITRNSASNCSQGGIQLWSTATNAKIVDVTYNTLYGSSVGFLIGGTSGTGLYTLRVVNNTFYNNINTVLSIFTVDFSMSPSITSLLVENNIFDGIDAVNGTHNEIALVTQSSATVDYNMHTHNLIFNNTTSSAVNWAIWQGYGYDPHGFSLTDPNFVNPSLGNFSLQPGSPAIGTGVFISGISTSNPPNIGAK